MATLITLQLYHKPEKELRLSHTSIAEFLVQRSADLNSRTTLDGLTPFQLALTYQHNELANWLHQMNTAHRKVSPSSSISQHLSLKQTTLESLRKKFQ
ncbi:unnamed protein product [Trichobilharzia regenti]|nr:unnamed protein product [Trichobilharzia regenti]